MRKTVLVKLFKERRYECGLKSRKRKKSVKRVVLTDQGYKRNYKKKGSIENQNHIKELKKFHSSLRRTSTMSIVYYKAWPNNNLNITKKTFVYILFKGIKVCHKFFQKQSP